MTRRLAAILMADVVGFSRLMHEDEAGTLAALKERRKSVVEPLVKQHAGRIVKFLGDGVLIEFASAVNAVAFALDLQRRMGEMNEPVPGARRIRLRVGINLGDVIGEGADIYGDGVNIAARLEGLAEPGGICISGKVHEEVRGKLDLSAEDLGEQMLKNISSPVRCWRISAARSREMVASGATGARISIAVLPFVNMSGDVAQDYFVDGLTEDLITALAKFRWFSVLSRNATFQFKGRAVDIPAIGRQLGARYVLEGSLRTSGNRIRIVAQLIDAESGAHVWAERFDRELADVFVVQDEIVNAIAGQLHGVVTDAVVAGTRIAPSTSLTAYEHFLRGRSAWRRGAAVETLCHWLESVEADPSYAPALASVGFFYAEDIWMQTSGMPIAELERLAVDYAERAISADSADPYVQHYVGTAFMTLGDLDRAVKHLEKAITLNPHFPNSRLNLGWAMTALGEHQKGLDLIAKAIHIDPRLPPAMQSVPFVAHCFLGQADEAKRHFDGIQNPFAFFHLLMAICFSSAGRTAEARAQLAIFEAKRAPSYDASGFVRQVAKCLRLPADRDRLLDGFRKLGLPV